MKISIFGTGSWGCAIAHVLSEGKLDKKIFCYVRNTGSLKASNPLMRIANRKNIIITDNIEELKNSDLIFIGVQSIYFRTACELLDGVVKNQTIISLSKGIEKNSTMLMTEIAEEILKTNKVMALSGANFASEIMQNKPSISVLTSNNISLQQSVKKIIESNAFQVETSTDIKGVQVCGAVKNILGLASGFFISQNSSNNFQSALLVKGMRELKKAIHAFGGNIETANNHCGLGDLFLSFSSLNSRNTTLGLNIKKYGIKKALEYCGNNFPEGYHSAYSLKQKLIKENINDSEMPICNLAYNILYENSLCEDTLSSLSLK